MALSLFLKELNDLVPCFSKGIWQFIQGAVTAECPEFYTWTMWESKNTLLELLVLSALNNWFYDLQAGFRIKATSSLLMRGPHCFVYLEGKVLGRQEYHSTVLWQANHNLEPELCCRRTIPEIMNESPYLGFAFRTINILETCFGKKGTKYTN